MTLSTRTHAAQQVLHAVHVMHHALRHPIHLPHGPHLHGFHLHGPHPLHHVRPIIHVTHEATFDDLEGRTLMSAIPLAEAVPTTSVTRAATVVRATATTTKAAVAPAGPSAVADPKVNNPSYAYASFASDPLFAPGGPSINDVSQGEVGDCYLLSVLSSVAKTDPTLIRQDITANANGTYTVTFGGAKHGTPITVDASLPTMPGGRPAYAQLGADDSLWVALFEKAYADFASPKVDAYADINGGWMGDAFTALGLKSTSTFSTASPTALATVVQKDLRAGDFVTLGTTSSVAASNPLVAGHAYEVDSVTTNARGQVTSITMRNPWGNDVADGGYVTLTAQQAFAAFAGMSVSHA